MEDYTILSQTEIEGRCVFLKVLRKSDDAIFEVGKTTNSNGVVYSIFFEGDDYRKMIIAFRKGDKITPFRLNDAPKHGEENNVVYFVSNEMPTPKLLELMTKVVSNGVIMGEEAKQYKELLQEWNYGKFFYSKKDNLFISTSKANKKEFTDYKYMFKVGV